MADYLKIPELARRLDVSEKTARTYVKNGTIPSVFVGGAYRVSEKDLANYLHRSEVKPLPKTSAPAGTTNMQSAPGRHEPESSESQAKVRIGQNWPENPSEQERIDELEKVAGFTAEMFLRWQRIRQEGYKDSQAMPGLRALEVRNAARWSLQEAHNNARRLDPRSDAEQEATHRMYDVLDVGREVARQFENDAERLLAEASELSDAGKRDIDRLLKEAEQAQRSDA